MPRERARAVAGVLKAVPFGAPRGQGQHRIQAIERLDGGFLIDAEDRCMLRAGGRGGCRHSRNTDETYEDVLDLTFQDHE
jgi:hypothetical protein